MSVHTNAQEVLLFLAVIIFAFVESHAVEERHHLLHTWFRYTTELFRVYVQISSLSPHGSLKYKETPTEEPEVRKKKQESILTRRGEDQTNIPTKLPSTELILKYSHFYTTEKSSNHIYEFKNILIIQIHQKQHLIT